MRQFELIAACSKAMVDWAGAVPRPNHDELPNGQFEDQLAFVRALVTADRHASSGMAQADAEPWLARRAFAPQALPQLTVQRRPPAPLAWTPKAATSFTTPAVSSGRLPLAYPFLAGVLGANAPALCGHHNPTAESYCAARGQTTKSGATWSRLIQYGGNNRTPKTPTRWCA